MTPDQIQLAVERALGQSALFSWLHYTVLLLVVAAGTYLGSYLREKGKNLATKEDIKAVTATI
jgi:hypothetical protein